MDKDKFGYQVNILDWKVTKIRKIISIFEGLTLTRNNLKNAATCRNVYT